MKTHELAFQLEFLAKMLRSLPDIELKGNIKDIPKLLQGESCKKNEPFELPNRIEVEIENMAPKELQSFLTENPDGKRLTNSQLSSIACKLGLTTSKRQSRDALVNQLFRFVESNNLDSIMRKARSDAKSVTTQPGEHLKHKD